MKERIENLINNQKLKKKFKKNDANPIELDSFIENVKYHSFIRYPWSLWVPGFISLLIGVVFNYFIIFEVEREFRSYSSILITILIYYLAFIILYTAQIEVFVIDKTINRVFLKYYNVYCSKDEKSLKIDEVDDIEIVLKGIQRGNNDTTKYIIRYKSKKENLEFGSTFSIKKIAMKVSILLIKYQICCAMTKGIIIKNVDFSFVINESDVAENFY